MEAMGVCRRIDEICQIVLNCGFNRVVRQHSISFKRIKAMLPRRESERRNHCLARHADILTSIETRLSMLSMTYSKYMDINLCCFIPGRVLDEINRILCLIAKTTKPLRPHEILQELRDISSMAIEHFDEKIANTLKKTYAESGASGFGKPNTTSSGSDKNRLSLADTSASCLALDLGMSSSYSGGGCWNPTSLRPSSPPNCDSIRQRFNTLVSLGQTLRTIKKSSATSSAEETAETEAASGSQEHRSCTDARVTMSYFRKLELEYKKGNVKMHRMQQIQTHQSRRLQQAQTSIGELNLQIVELKKRLEDIDAKNREISANIKQINTGDREPTSAIVAPEAPSSLVVTAPPPPLPLKKLFDSASLDGKEQNLFNNTADVAPLSELIIVPGEPAVSSTSKIIGVATKRHYDGGVARTTAATSSSSFINQSEELVEEDSAKRPKF